MTIGRGSRDTVFNIQILRFVAAAMVLIAHLNHEIIQRPEMRVGGFRAFEPVWWGGGVDIFFVISGFIMYHISADHFGGSGASRRFMARRLIRLVPPYWAFTALVLLAMALFPAQLANSRTSPGHILGSLLFIPVANPAGIGLPVLILGWTLNFEMLFYAVFATGLLFPRRIGVIIIAAILILLASGMAFGPLPLPFGSWCSTIVLEFLFGIAIAATRRSGFRMSHAAGIALAGCGIAGMLAMTAMGISGVNHLWRFLWAGVPALFLCAGAALVREPDAPGPLKRALIYGGDISFAIYLSHPFTLTILAAVATAARLDDPWVYLAITFVGCLIASALVYELFEKPTYVRLSQLYNRWQAGPRVPARSSRENSAQPRRVADRPEIGGVRTEQGSTRGEFRG